MDLCERTAWEDIGHLIDEFPLLSAAGNRGQEYVQRMANFKRKGPKSTRAGCLMCKPHKRQGTKLKERVTFNDWRQIRTLDEQMAELRRGDEGKAEG